MLQEFIYTGKYLKRNAVQKNVGNCDLYFHILRQGGIGSMEPHLHA